MIIEATHSKIDILDINRVNITYNLISDGIYYGIECYREGADSSSPREYGCVSRLTKDRAAAEDCLREMVEKNVFPMHLKDVIEDKFDLK